MSDSTAQPAGADDITITVKSSADQKYTITVSPTIPVSDLKQILEPQSSIPKDRQRLIYSGRVLKDHETLSTYRIQSGHTIHLVKGAVPAGGATGGSAAAAAPAQAVPTNISAGQGAGNPLAGLTGARYAGLAQLPSASMFGPDGGMGPPPSEEQLLQAMSNPMFQQSINQMLQNPQLLDYIIQSSPGLQNMGPQVRSMLQSEQFRSMMTNPDVMRQMMSMNRMFGGNAMGGGFPMPGQQQGGAFPEPGRTNTTTTAEGGAAPAGATAGAPGAAGAAPANPFAMLFPGGQPPAGGADPFSMFNPAFFGGNQAAGAGTGAAPAATGEAGQQAPAANPFMSPELLNMMFGGAGAGAAAAPEDNRPPEERYEGQLRQLNELGFFDFDRNVRALRRSGGNVQGAIEALLDGAV
ncbi:uncharacterized protein V1510DRAFT_377410 [Dipodascopsis tothii]|uniref:uncharacterized protein n=1 Tax=Dipodascopsis tothii TaxID=44089 RepID=UPI0034CF779A